MRLRTLRDFTAYERTVDNRNPPEPEEEDMESQAPYGIPEPLSHLYAVIQGRGTAEVFYPVDAWRQVIPGLLPRAGEGD